MYEIDIVLDDQSLIHFRPGVKQDFDMLWMVLSTLSEQSLQFLPNRFTQEQVKTWMSQIDYESLLLIVAEVKDNEKGKTQIVALATLEFQKGESRKHRAEFDIIVHDSFQGKGLGTVLSQYILDIAREKGLKKVFLKTNTRNLRAIYVYEKLGFEIEGKLIMEH